MVRTKNHEKLETPQPYYIILDNEGAALTAPTFYDENITKFVEWLETGMKNYQNEK